MKTEQYNTFPRTLISISKVFTRIKQYKSTISLGSTSFDYYKSIAVSDTVNKSNIHSLTIYIYHFFEKRFGQLYFDQDIYHESFEPITNAYSLAAIERKFFELMPIELMPSSIGENFKCWSYIIDKKMVNHLASVRELHEHVIELYNEMSVKEIEKIFQDNPYADTNKKWLTPQLIRRIPSKSITFF